MCELGPWVSEELLGKYLLRSSWLHFSSRILFLALKIAFCCSLSLRSSSSWQILACADFSSLLRNSIVTSSLVNPSTPFFFFFLFMFALVSGGGGKITVEAKADEE